MYNSTKIETNQDFSKVFLFRSDYAILWAGGKTMDMQTIGEKVRQTRKTEGMTQEKLANLTGLSTMSIRRYESGERIITDETLQKIADALCVQPWELDEKSLKVAKLMSSSEK